MKNMKTIENKLSFKVDQRDVVIPSVWIPNSKKESNWYNRQEPISSKNRPGNGSILTSGNDKYLTQRIVKMLSSAKSTAILCSFLLADKYVEDAIYASAQRGVRVYLMLACETRLDDDNPDDDFEKKCLDQHKAMLNRLAGKVMIRSASHYHAKAVLIDAIGPNKSEAQGLLLTANLTREALERNEELAVYLSPPEIKEIVHIFRWSFFENAEHQMLDNANFTSVEPISELEHPSSSDLILSTTSQSQSIRKHTLELINRATSRLIISSFGWQEDHQVTNAICNKAREGTDVVILARMRPSSMGALMKIKSAGAKVFGFKWLHAKAIWNDADDAMVMSANLQHHGLDIGFEVGVKLSDGRAGILKKYLLNFLNNKHSELRLDIRLGKLIGPVKVWSNDQFEDVEIQGSVTERLNPVVAKCASNLKERASIPNPKWIDSPAHEIEYQWIVKAPPLPKSAREVFWEEKQETANPNEKTGSKKDKRQNKPKIVKHSYTPKVYKTDNSNHLIAISNSDEIRSAISLRNEKFSRAKIVVLSSHGGNMQDN